MLYKTKVLIKKFVKLIKKTILKWEGKNGKNNNV